MLSVQREKAKNKTLVSCVLTANSLTDMSQLSPPFCIGWILAAVGSWTARSNLPDGVRIESDAVIKSIQVFLPSFNYHDMTKVLALPCWSSRCDFLFARLALETDTNSMTRKDMGLGFGCFSFFDGNKATPDLGDVQNRILESDRMMSGMFPAEPVHFQ